MRLSSRLVEQPRRYAAEVLGPMGLILSVIGIVAWLGGVLASLVLHATPLAAALWIGGAGVLIYGPYQAWKKLDEDRQGIRISLTASAAEVLRLQQRNERLQLHNEGLQGVLNDAHNGRFDQIARLFEQGLIGEAKQSSVVAPATQQPLSGQGQSPEFRRSLSDLLGAPSATAGEVEPSIESKPEEEGK